jgi:hypothetical protein
MPRGSKNETPARRINAAARDFAHVRTKGQDKGRFEVYDPQLKELVSVSPEFTSALQIARAASRLRGYVMELFDVRARRHAQRLWRVFPDGVLRGAQATLEFLRDK